MPTPSEEVAAGFFSGVADACASHPLDQVKTQFHVNRGANGSVLDALRSQYALGGVPRLYRGLLAAAVRPQALCMFTGNEWSQRFVRSRQLIDVDGQLSSVGGYLAGFLTGYVEAASVTPFEVVKVRMQSLEHVGKYSSSSQCVRAMLREEGVASLYTGFWATAWRGCIFNGVFFGSLHWCKKELPLPEPASGAGKAALDLGLGFATALVATCAKMPLDVAKSRLQNQLLPPAGEAPRYRHTLQVVATIAREEGPAACYKGFQPTAMRMVSGQGVAYASFELALGWFRRVSAERAPSTTRSHGVM